jgi:hypothetical protein
MKSSTPRSSPAPSAWGPRANSKPIVASETITRTAAPRVIDRDVNRDGGSTRN